MIKYFVVCVLFYLCRASKDNPTLSEDIKVNNTVAETIKENVTLAETKKENITIAETKKENITLAERRHENIRLSDVKRIINKEELILPTDPPKENITLADLDSRIVKAILHPKRNVDVGLQLLKDTFNYYSEIDDIADLYVADPYEGIKAINESGVRIKPKFIGLEYDKKKLKEIYSWGEDEAEELKTNIGGGKYVWERIQRLLVETTTPTTTTTTTTTTQMTTTTTTVTTTQSPSTTHGINYTQISAETVEFSEVPVSNEKSEEVSAEENTKKKKE